MQELGPDYVAVHEAVQLFRVCAWEGSRANCTSGRAATALVDRVEGLGGRSAAGSPLSGLLAGREAGGTWSPFVTQLPLQDALLRARALNALGSW